VDEKFLEQASELEQARRDEAVRQARERVQGSGQPDCEDCGEPIPRIRREAVPGAIRCIGCQKLFEGMSK
jgi:phage/conjugal plasmid C-4 type zinc finger TraR family protein